MQNVVEIGGFKPRVLLGSQTLHISAVQLGLSLEEQLRIALNQA